MMKMGEKTRKKVELMIWFAIIKMSPKSPNPEIRKLNRMDDTLRCR